MTEPNKIIIEHEAFTNIINLIIEKARSFPEYPVQALIKEAVNLSGLYNNQDGRKLTDNISASLHELKQKKSPEEFAEILLNVCQVLNGKEPDYAKEV